MNARTLFGYFTGRTRPISPRSDFTVQTISLIPRLPALFLFKIYLPYLQKTLAKLRYACYNTLPTNAGMLFCVPKSLR